MKKIMLLIAMTILNANANANAAQSLNLEKLAFPALSSHRMQAENPYYMYRTIIFSAGKVVLDMPTTADQVYPSNAVEQSNYCKLHMAYYSEVGFPEGEIVLEGGNYPISAQVGPGMSSAGPFTPGVNSPVRFYISRPLRAVANEYQYAEADIEVGGTHAKVWITGIECSLNGMSNDLKSIDDAMMIKAGLGDAVSISESK